MAVLCVLLAAVCFCDYRKKKIPNILVVITALTGILWRLGREGPMGMLYYMGGAIFLMCLMYPFFKAGTAGAGDVKLFGVTAGFLPADKILLFLFTSLLVAAIFSVFKFWKERNIRGGICLSGPALAGVLLYLGGVY